jgi:hypothetical protein
MSPFTAFFIGLWCTGIVALSGATLITLYGMRIADRKASVVVDLLGDAMQNLPALIEALPPAVETALNDHRAPEYVENVEVRVDFSTQGRAGFLTPVLTITNKGNEVISMLAVRVAALGERGVPFQEWTEVVATPFAFCDDWRGPMLPHATRHVVLSAWRSPSPDALGNLTGAHEVSELRVWQPKEAPVRSASAQP